VNAWNGQRCAFGSVMQAALLSGANAAWREAAEIRALLGDRAPPTYLFSGPFAERAGENRFRVRRAAAKACGRGDVEAGAFSFTSESSPARQRSNGMDGQSRYIETDWRVQAYCFVAPPFARHWMSTSTIRRIRQWRALRRRSAHATERNVASVLDARQHELPFCARDILEGRLSHHCRRPE